MTARALIVAGARSGSGKTSVTLGLLSAFAARGMAVRGVKSGPDYIDTGFHAAATGRPGLNLDSWAMPPALLRGLAAEAADSELVLVEGAMGLFDGVACEPGRRGSAADLAALFDMPVLLVLDVSGQSQTAAAIAHGFAGFDPSVRIAGVVLNRVGSDRHRRLVADAIEALGIPVVGALARDATPTLPERHLGLVQAEEHAGLDTYLAELRRVAEGSIDLDAVAALARPFAIDAPAAQALPPPGQRVALARDPAFSFVYPHLLAGWRRAGAEIVSFSPLADEPPPPSCDACWLPGGYPELHADRLAAASRFAAGMRAFAEQRAVHGECGGYMVLGRSLVDAGGTAHGMLGLLAHATSFARRRLHLGYREARLLADCPLGPAGAEVRGHEFHYAHVTDPGDDAPLAELADGVGRPLGPAGGRRGRVTGTFFHAIARA
ncbi:MAG TPA: cobyrinate a,c-diamide synthase [Geminicoccaceae bacterium]|nr:cobyrinate a,c-diamide synthase [Geminicoccus sp.]HMU51746.1 cobyrinate a,c-diamide synthase [Geminicoccaceae bacterium]